MKCTVKNNFHHTETRVKIGKEVQDNIDKIFDYCDTYHTELVNLMDKSYSKENFDINFPFCTEESKIHPDEDKRYWKKSYVVIGKSVRVSSQWFSKSKPLFEQYLLEKKLSKIRFCLKVLQTQLTVMEILKK